VRRLAVTMVVDECTFTVHATRPHVATCVNDMITAVCIRRATQLCLRCLVSQLSMNVRRRHIRLILIHH